MKANTWKYNKRQREEHEMLTTKSWIQPCYNPLLTISYQEKDYAIFSVGGVATYTYENILRYQVFIES